MIDWRCYRAPLLFMILLVAACVLMVLQFQRAGSRHIQMRELFILCSDRGHKKAAEYYYQRLIHQLKGLPDETLWHDHQRTLLLVDPDQKQRDNLVWKYYWAVKQTLDRRTEKRLESILPRFKEQLPSE